jgi:ribosomal-protein-alanine N-acetyltransferase
MFDEFPIFQFGEYRVRQIDAARDAQRFFDYVTKDEVSNFIGSDSIPQNVDQAYRELNYWGSLFAMGRSYYWAISNKNDEIIGTAGFNNISRQHQRGEISYDLDKNYWGNGIMTNAIFQIIEYSFQKLELVRIQATVGKHNPRSIKLLESLNFKKEGELAKYEKLKGKHYDFYMYAVTRNV